MKCTHLTYLLCLLSFLSCSRREQKAFESWEVYGGDKGMLHYSSQVQIDTSNVKNLQVAWIYHTGDAGGQSQLQVNPVVVDGTLYGVSPQLVLFALDAATGKQTWSFNPADALKNSTSTEGEKISINVCRGVTYFKDDQGAHIFYTAGSKLYCIQAATGKIAASFGNGGRIDLHEGLDRDIKDLYVTSTTPGVVYKNLLIVGTRVAEEAGAAPGHIRAYDVHTGKLQWIFHTIPFPGETGYESWEDTAAYRHAGGANAWAGLSLDEARGIVFAPVGSATYDFWGGKRKGNNLFANCVVALDAATGKRVWHYQTVHHDVWDRDPPTAPVLVTVLQDGQKRDAVVQLTKSGFIFLLDRTTGQPLHPIVETPMPASALAGEQLSPTQPVPQFFEPFSRQTLTEADLNNLVPDSSYQDIKQRFASYKKGSLYTPPSEEGTLLVPGTLGGAEWGGPAYDPQTGLLYINSNETPNIITMKAVKRDTTAMAMRSNGQVGKALYTSACMGCHGQNREGSGVYPSLIGVGKRYDEAAFKTLLQTGRRMMPAFTQLSSEQETALASLVLDNPKLQQAAYRGASEKKDAYLEMPYLATGYNRFLTREGYPASKPPWGSLTAVNLHTGKTAWKIPLGEYPEFKARGIATGSDNFGGPVVTAGGLLFIAATRDEKFRAYNKRTGALLWETGLPAAGFATPSVYKANGRQYIVIACGGGGKAKTKLGDAYVAFALLEK